MIEQAGHKDGDICIFFYLFAIFSYPSIMYAKDAVLLLLSWLPDLS